MLREKLRQANEQIAELSRRSCEQETELEKMSKLYDEQLAEVQTAFREKNEGLEKQIETLKQQILSMLET